MLEDINLLDDQAPKEQTTITINAAFSKATTTIDGGWNITFSVSQDEAHKVVLLSALRDILLELQIKTTSD